MPGPLLDKSALRQRRQGVKERERERERKRERKREKERENRKINI
jgi:hypothetical protein